LEEIGPTKYSWNSLPQTKCSFCCQTTVSSTNSYSEHWHQCSRENQPMTGPRRLLINRHLREQTM